jgi:predicted  nucleic acid-binding Zn-ribbon protein
MNYLDFVISIKRGKRMHRLLHFPEGYPDEDFRSIIYRYHVRSGNTSMAETKKELFDVKTEKFWQFPRKLSTLLNRLPLGHNMTDEEVLSHTWFPLIRPFITDERLSPVYKDIMYGDGPRFVGRVVEKKQLTYLSKEIKYCPYCMDEDFKKYGESYVHLSHQMSFVEHCPKHKVKLSEVCQKCGKIFSKIQQGVLTSVPCCQDVEFTKTTHDNKVEKLKGHFLNELIYFKNNVFKLNCNSLYSKLIIKLNKNGYIDLLGNIDKKRLMLDVLEYYQKDFLNKIGYYKNTYILSKTELLLFLNPKHMTRFIYLYLLVILFLSGSIKNFICSHERPYSIPIPFGNGPWECYNPICPLYKVKTIYKCGRRYRSNRFTVKFCCETCGFQYTRRWFNHQPEDSQITVVDLGQFWRIKVIELYHSGFSDYKIAQKLNSTRSTVRNFIKKIEKLNSGDKNINEIDDYVKTIQINRKNNENDSSYNALEEIVIAYSELAATDPLKESKKEKYRVKVQNLISTETNIKRSDIKRIAYKEYKWLIQNDAEWFDNVLPSRQGRKPILDYTSLDNELVSKVKKVSQVIYAENPPTRIKKTSILNKLEPVDKNRINNLNKKLPRTLKEIEKLTESIDDYLIRNTPNLFYQLMDTGRYTRVTFESFRSVRSSYRNCTEETKKKIENILDELQNDNY